MIERTLYYGGWAIAVLNVFFGIGCLVAPEPEYLNGFTNLLVAALLAYLFTAYDWNTRKAPSAPCCDTCGADHPECLCEE
jgi:hypothetical protein